MVAIVLSGCAHADSPAPASAEASKPSWTQSQLELIARAEAFLDASDAFYAGTSTAFIEQGQFFAEDAVFCHAPNAECDVGREKIAAMASGFNQVTDVTAINRRYLAASGSTDLRTVLVRYDAEDVVFGTCKLVIEGRYLLLYLDADGLVTQGHITDANPDQLGAVMEVVATQRCP